MKGTGGKSESRSRAAIGWAVGVFLLCQLVAYLGYRHTMQQQQGRDRARMLRFADRLRVELGTRFNDWEDLLLAARGLEATGTPIGARQWEAFTGQFDFSRHPGIKSLARIVRVPKGGIEGFMADGLREGILYDVRPPKALVGGPEDRALLADPPDHYLIRYAAPMATNALALGLDVGRNPIQRASADRACATGRPVLTGKLIFNDLGSARPGAGMFLPLYRGGGVPGLEQDRIALSDGWLSVGLLLDDTFAGAMRTLRDAIAIEVEDVTPGEAVRLWVDPRLESLPPGYRPLVRADEIAIAGRTWRFRLKALPAFMEDSARTRGWNWVTGGVLVGLALALATWSLAGSRTRAFALAQRLTRTTREALQRFETLMRNVPLGAIDWDPGLLVREWNPAAEQMFGIPRRAALARSGPELDFPAAFIDSVQDALSTGTVLRGSAEFRGPGGAEIRCEWTHTPLRDADGRAVGLTTLLEDVTGRRREEEALRLSQKLESLGVLAGGIAHDFNNLLLGISGNAELAMMKASDGEIRAHLDRVLAGTRRASDLARQMLAYAGQAAVEIRPFDVNTEVLEILDLLEASLPKIVTLETDLARDPMWVAGDVAQVHQVLVNLVTNGAEAIGGRPGTVRIRTEPLEADAALVRRLGSSSALAPGPCVRLSVEDDGGGMEPAILARIFDPFFTTKFTGRGLGLSAVLGIIKAHRGGLSVQSQPARGTLFQLYLPRIPAPLESERATQEMALVRAPALTVLFADDEPTLRELALEALQGQGHQVLVAADGLEAVERFQQAARVDVVVLDLTMPRMGGLEAFRRIRAQAPTVRVILSSGYTDLVLESAAEPRPDAFLHKPYRIQDLLRKIENLAG